MIYSKKIFTITFPFTDLSSLKVRPALAISEPDILGDLDFIFITSKDVKLDNFLDIPDGVLPHPSRLHLSKRYKLNKSIINKEISAIPNSFFEIVLRNLTLANVELYYHSIHKSKQEIPFIPNQSKIPYAGRVFDEKEITNLVDSSLEFWLTTGRYADKFENSFSSYLGVKNTLLVNSGSSANLIAFYSLTSPNLKERQIKKGDEIITVAAGFPTTIVPSVQYGAVPVFVDITLPTYNIDVTKLEEAYSNKTKAVMVAHTLGNPFDLQTIKEFCDKHNLWLIEDNCDALGSTYKFNGEWKKTGTIGDIGTSSFYPPHHMTMGEGGAVYMHSNRLKKIAESFRDWGRDCWCQSGKDDTCGKRFNWELGELPKGYDHKYIYAHFGFNLKVTDMQAAIGCAQLEKIDSFVEARQRNWKVLKAGLLNLSDYFILPEPTANSNPSWFGFLLTIRDEAKFTRNEIVSFLEKNLIQTRMLFAGNFLRHPVFDEMRKEQRGYRVVGNLKNTDTVMNRSFWLGVYPGMKPEMLQYMIEIIQEFCKNG